MDTKMQSMKQKRVSDVTSQSDAKCLPVDLVMKMKKDSMSCSDRDVATITKKVIDFQSTLASFSNISQAIATEEGDLENKESTSSESTRSTGDAVCHDFKPDNGNNINKQTSMAANASASGREPFELVETIYDERNLLFNCQICGESIRSQWMYHSQLNSYACEKCFKQSSHLKLLDSGRKKIYQCDSCEKCFRWLSDLKSHKLLHSGIKPYKCEHCDKAFIHKSNLTQHKLVHSDSNPFKCEHCNKSFISKSHLYQHTLLHSGNKPFKCEHCDKCFTQKSKLKQHKLLHSGTNPFKCEFCDKCFTQKSHVTTHKLLHSGAKPFKCEHCDKCFTAKSHLNRHKLLHSGIKPYKCEHCGKCFTQNATLNRHQVVHLATKHDSS